MNDNIKKLRCATALGTVFVIFCSLLVLFLVAFFVKPAQTVNAETPAIDPEAVSSLKAQESEDVGSVVAAMRETAQSRKESISESESIEASIEESVRMSIAFEESSIAQSEYESSVAESSSIAEMEAINAPFAGSHIVAGEVRYDLDDTDIPYLRRLFSYCLVVGNSRAKNAVDCGIFTQNEIFFVSGVSVEVMRPYAEQAAYRYAPKTMFVMGLNDLGYFKSDDQAFKNSYREMINAYRAINPTSKIYLQEILPVPDEAAPYFWRYKLIPVFNDRIKELCSEMDCTYVSASEYADFKYINSEDHAHYGKDFYFLWAQAIASQLHLYEDQAGVNHEIEWYDCKNKDLAP